MNIFAWLFYGLITSIALSSLFVSDASFMLASVIMLSIFLVIGSLDSYLSSRFGQSND